MKKKKWPETWRTINPGCMVLDAGNARTYLTGSWKAERPEWDDSKCIKCGICYIFCPEGCVTQNEDGLFRADLDYCKGCGICAHECWPGAINMVEEG